MVALAVAGAAVADTGEHVIQGDRSAGGIRIGRSTPAQVKALFGAPSTVRRPFAQSCVQSWKGAKLTVEFFTFEDKPCVKGVALIVTVRDGAVWRTAARPPRRRHSRARAGALPASATADGRAGRQRLLARDEEDLRRGRRRLVSGTPRADEGRPGVGARRPHRRLRLGGWTSRRTRAGQVWRSARSRARS